VKITLIALTMTLLASTASRADELVLLNTRAGVTQPVAFIGSQSPAAATILLLFPGGSGGVGFQQKDVRVQPHAPYRFSERTDLLIRDGVVVAIVDAPSDRVEGMDRAFRQSATHVGDMAFVARELRARCSSMMLNALHRARRFHSFSR